MIAVFLLQEAQCLLRSIQGPGSCPMGHRGKHRYLFHHQHQLAVVQRRADYELSDSDVGADSATFLSGAVGIAAAMAVIRGFIRKNTATIGNFWVDLTRSVLYLLLPLAIVWTVVFASQGVVQTLGPYVTAQTPDSGEQPSQLGPPPHRTRSRSWAPNGGGFFNVNSAHPFENPTPLTDFLQVLGMLLIAASLPFALGPF